MANFWIKLWENLPYFLSILLGGAVWTVTVTLASLAMALVAGLVVALLNMSQSLLLKLPSRAYIEVMRGTPVLAQLYIIYFGLSAVGIEMRPITAAIVGLGLNGAAYLAEVYRAGIQSIHSGQIEAALSIGMTPMRAMRFIILPQAVRVMLPPLGNYGIQLFKDTAIVISIGVTEIMFWARNLVMETYLSMQIYLLVAVIYLCISLPLGRLVNRLEAARKSWQ
jgi:polar amino acid transport system permease protein/cystine transport system permease protein